MADRLIEITGYVTKAYHSAFTLHVISDNVENEQGEHPNISKEIDIFVPRNLYPDDFHTRFEMLRKGLEDGSKTYRHDSVEKCFVICKGLRKGALVNCKVFVINPKSNDDSTETYEISVDLMHIENYRRYTLFLYPNPEDFKHLDGDIPETLKFRKQNYYTDINSKRCEQITGGRAYKYSQKWWMNKNPKIVFPILNWIRIKMICSNLWERFTKRENLPKSSLIISIILSIITAISVVANIIMAWLLFFKNP